MTKLSNSLGTRQELSRGHWCLESALIFWLTVLAVTSFPYGRLTVLEFSGGNRANARLSSAATKG